MTFLIAMLLVVGIAMAVLAASALLVWVEKKKPPKQFDERQQIVRGKAYKWACVTGFCYFIAVGILDLVLRDGVQADLFLLVMIGVTLSAFVRECYCCFHDAYLPLTQSPKVNIILLYVSSVIFLLNAASWVSRMRVTITESGFEVLDFGEVALGATGNSVFVWMFLMVAVMSIIIATMELLRYMRNKME